tara:strand:+ start:327 stop:515 length:189 start_codon:yes stop_codon:yes gene_type:complete
MDESFRRAIFAHDDHMDDDESLVAARFSHTMITWMMMSLLLPRDVCNDADANSERAFAPQGS